MKMRKNTGSPSKSELAVATIRMRIEQIVYEQNVMLLKNPSDRQAEARNNTFSIDLTGINYIPDENTLTGELMKDTYGSLSLVSVRLGYEKMHRMLYVEFGFAFP